MKHYERFTNIKSEKRPGRIDENTGNAGKYI